MDQFEQAKLKSEKQRERVARSAARKPVQEVISKKVEAPKPSVHEPGPMVLKISGPVEMTLLVDYAGTLLNSQQQEDVLRVMFKKALLPIGKVR